MTSVWQRAGVAYSQGAPLGASMDVARTTTTKTQARTAGQMFAPGSSFFPYRAPSTVQEVAAYQTAAAQAPTDAASRNFWRAIDWLPRTLGDGAEYAIRSVQERGLFQAIADDFTPNNPLSNERMDAVKAAEASPGQTLWLALRDKGEDPFELLDDPTRQEEEQKYFATGWARWVSGSIDAAFQVFADPTIVGGKALSGVKAARGIASAEDVARAAAASDASTLTGKSRDLRNIWDEVVDVTEPGRLTNGTVGALANTKYFQQSTDAGAIPYMMARANELEPDAIARRQFKLDILAAGAGEAAALERVSQRSLMLRVELDTLNSDLDAARFARELVRPDGDQLSLFEEFNEAPQWVRQLEAHRPILQREFESLKRVEQIGYASGQKIEGAVGNRGELANLPVGGLTTGFSRAGAAREVATIAKTVQEGRFTSPFHLVTGRHLPSVTRLTAQDAPVVFREALDRGVRSRLLTKEQAQILHDDFMSAASRDATATKAQRGAVMRQFENAIDQGLSSKYNADLDKVRALMTAARDRRAKTLYTAQNRAFKAEPSDGYAVLREDDQAFALGPDVVRELASSDVPVMGTQLADLVSIIDPIALDKFMGRYGANGINGFARFAEGAWRPVEEFFTVSTRLWKFSALFRVAYPMRVQIDTQARMLASLGPLRWFANAVAGTGNVAYNNLRRIDQASLDQLTRKFHAYQEWDDLRYRGQTEGYTDEIKARQLELKAIMAEPPVARSGRTQRVRGTEMARYLGKSQYINRAGEVVGRRDRLREAYQNTQELERVRSFMDARESYVGLMTNGEQRLTHRFRSTGSWDRVGGDNPQWRDAYYRAVNHQIRNDPAAMILVRGGTNQDVFKWLASTAEGRAYWSAIGEHYAKTGGQDGFLVNLRQHVDTLLPNPSLRQIVATRGLQRKEIGTLWPTAAERPLVPTELLDTRTVKSALTDAYETTEESFFELASTLPENMMGRHPYYQAQFRAHMEQLVRDTGADADKLTLAQVRGLRQEASRLSRRDVAKVMFDTSAQTNLGYHMRFLSPFYSAWYDMMTKWSHIMGNHLEVAPLLYKAFTAPNRAGMVVDDDGNVIEADGKVIGADGTVVGQVNPFTEGNIILPAPEWINSWSGASDFKISKRALNVIFQGDPFFLPGPGPLVNITANEVMMKVFPEYGPSWADSWVGNYVTSGFGLTEESPLEQLRPAWMENAWTAYKQDRGEPRFSQSFAQEYQAIVSEVRNGTREPMDEDELEDLAAKRTRNKFILQFLGSYVAPVSTRPQSRMEYYLQQWRNYQRDYGLEAYDRFSEDYPEYTEMAITLSVNETGIDATEEAWQSVQPYRRDISRTPEYGWFFAGANNLLGEFDPNVHTAQKGQEIYPGSGKNFRRNKSVQEVVTDSAVRQGWADYQSVNSQLREELANRGLTSFAQRGAEDLRGIRDEFIDDLKQENSAWAEAYATRETGEAAAKFLSYATEMVEKHPELGDRSDIQTLGSYLEVRAQMQQALAGLGRRSMPMGDLSTIKDPQVLYLRQVWDDFTAELYDADIGFGQMWDRELEGDDLSFKIDSNGQVLSGIW